ncbi:5-methylthioribose kinase [Symbiobacterium terraclitae]|uniref:S-methyl-5-thioribose kinase n=1 Tax=Symbiobacterium terraclitae TaxID=557451 RepID=A0ABS4JTU8_9FIRM|nr:S-methyl-5-thioribose kinase [Symbiobacterium terraclitae]MBP2018955.1 5-methylthioribose kinase [Symbiobacterium terraclitae]
MAKYDQYFLMKPEDVIEYVKDQLDVFGPDADLECKEIGDGNLNYVFRVWDRKSSASVIVKQSGDTARISDEFKVSIDRNRIEAEALMLEDRLAPGLVPKVYKYDPVMNCTVMDDLSDHQIMRGALIKHEKFPLFADHITTFMVNTLLLTSDVVMDHKEKKDLARRFGSPDLCEITEDLVYTEPFNDYKGRNIVFPPNKEWVEREIYGDQELLLEVSKLKFDFMTRGQALIHGDLHTGSIFVRPDSTKVIDPEFAYYGPMGYDTGNVVANLFFAWANADATIADPAERADYIQWLEKTIVDVVDLFKAKFVKAWDEHATEVLARTPGFREWYLDTVLDDTAAVTGLELSRRILGIAKVKDITSIADEALRLRAERICLTAAKEYIKKRTQFRTGADFVAAFRRAMAQFPR